MIALIVISTYLALGLLTARLTVYSLDITKHNMDGQDFVLLPLAVIFWWFVVWFALPSAIGTWWDNREKGKGRPEWLVNSFSSIFGIKG